jgi:hypothetical protein
MDSVQLFFDLLVHFNSSDLIAHQTKFCTLEGPNPSLYFPMRIFIFYVAISWKRPCTQFDWGLPEEWNKKHI